MMRRSEPTLVFIIDELQSLSALEEYLDGF